VRLEARVKGHLGRSLGLILLLGMLAVPALPHEVGLRAIVQARGTRGESVTYSESTLPQNAQIIAVEIIADYSTGEPMAGAQVLIFAPGNPSVPWQRGTSDRQGRYRFTPDLSRRGRWTIRVEDAGHSSFMNLMI
jgi:hypothetical protein